MGWGPTSYSRRHMRRKQCVAHDWSSFISPCWSDATAMPCPALPCPVLFCPVLSCPVMCTAPVFQPALTLPRSIDASVLGMNEGQAVHAVEVGVVCFLHASLPLIFLPPCHLHSPLRMHESQSMYPVEEVCFLHAGGGCQRLSVGQHGEALRRHVALPPSRLPAIRYSIAVQHSRSNEEDEITT